MSSVWLWNRQPLIKDPSTGKRVSRRNPEAEWIRTAVPELRIVEDTLRQLVKARQAELAKVFEATTTGVGEARAKWGHEGDQQRVGALLTSHACRGQSNNCCGLSKPPKRWRRVSGS
jgi:site-specific DNA recombinase